MVFKCNLTEELLLSKTLQIVKTLMKTVQPVVVLTCFLQVQFNPSSLPCDSRVIRHLIYAPHLHS